MLVMEIIEVILEIFSDIINEFLFELNNGLLNLVLHSINGMSQSRKYGRHRSLVRLIGAGLPLKPCQRTYSQILFSDNQCGLNLRRESEPLDDPSNGPNDFNAWSRGIKSDAPNAVSSVTYSTPKLGSLERQKTNEISAEKFAALEEQVLQLQADIAKILSSQLLQPPTDSGSSTPSEETKDRGCEEEILEDGALPTNFEEVPSIPPPPPPPPPLPRALFSLPPQPIIEGQSFADQINTYSIQSKDPPHKRIPASSMVPGMDEVLRNIGSVKLRPVERSPGGTPLRRRPLTPPRDDPAALLAAALRRRFAHMRPIEQSPERLSLDNSNHKDFSDLSPKPFEELDPFSYSLSPQNVNNLGR